ncbi:hypothetical protein HAP48_0000495 (plasmid) [Bradyrhizobium septentrionale]|uniref:Uncharacterized protein n=1 Tax=Bradyrhizobium septentrionale TaxID=1404411 RepID=A0A973WA89_9BRAD|nr:hypothetical protein [Bradyrhizobium septentrionale]UGY11958.1 hypothetical protein HAP48_0000495 [Bradyrhizobium septentrionale]UGY30159.1 hypothetical protein HU675_0047880 [Bradyrhizobium septentrionale]
MSAGKMGIKPVDLEGDVRMETVAPGSKSERSAVTLRTLGGDTYVLQTQDGPAFGVDDALQALVGRRIQASGVASDQNLILRKWMLLD